jgi:hypothetical protein
MSAVSTIPQETRIRIRARTTPAAVANVRRRLRPIERSDMRQRTGRRRSGGSSRSGRLSRPPPAGAKRRIASAGGIRAAKLAGAPAASSPVSSPKATPISGVVGCSSASDTGISSSEVYRRVTAPASSSPTPAPSTPATIPAISP